MKSVYFQVLRSHIITVIGKVPVVNSILRKRAHKFEEGSIVRIKSGLAAGMLWKRYRRNVNAYWLGNYELPVQRRIALELKKGDTFFDIGANAGFFSVIAARIVGDRGCVIAFEPLPVNVETIEEQFEINRLQNCRCVSAAVGRTGETRQVIVPKRGDDKASLPSARLRGGSDSQEKSEEILYSYAVPVTSLDIFVDRCGVVPDVMKIDVEGGGERCSGRRGESASVESSSTHSD